MDLASPLHATRQQRVALRVVLVSMPFMDHRRPSIQLGLLKAIAEQHGFSVRTLHANLDFARLIGADRYAVLSAIREPLLGDWLFSIEAFPGCAPDRTGRFLDAFSDALSRLGGDGDDWRRMLLSIRDEVVPTYLDQLIASFAWHDARVVGFTSTFHQNAASIALALRLKTQHTSVTTVFGGANFDDEMGLELVRTVPSIDFAVIGEGEHALLQLLDALASGSDTEGIPGVAHREDSMVRYTETSHHLTTLDNLPAPDYSEYFEHVEELGLLTPIDRPLVWLPIETARGCWWGEKHHCTFCGLNGSTMQFRTKSASQVLDQLATQAQKYRSFKFEAVDNILNMRYLQELFPKIVEGEFDYEIFYEVKANLTRRQIKTLADAGVRRMQPGLESLSSHVLNLMQKGVRASQNVNLLRWCRYYGIEVEWNILWGFPGETEHDYAEQAAVIPHLVHLQPPGVASRIWLERFSPLFSDVNLLPVERRCPERSYGFIYPNDMDLSKLAYFFDYTLKDPLPDAVYANVARAANEWSRLWAGDKRPSLTYWHAPELLQIYDARHEGEEGTYNFEGMLAAIYFACSERPITAAALSRQLGVDLPAKAIEDILVEFEQRGLMFLDGGMALSLAIPAVTGR